MATTTEQLLIEIKADIKDLKTNLTGASKEIDKFKNTSKKDFLDFKNVAETALGFGLANIVQVGIGAIKEFVVESVKSFIEYERAFNSLEIQTGRNAQKLIDSLSKASKGVVSNLDLIKTANRALALGISENQLPQLMEVAAARAKVMGITTTQAFNDMATGIGRQSKLILDNLGIIVDLDETYRKYAETNNLNVKLMDDIAKKTAIANAIYENSKGLIAAMNVATEDHKTSLERLSAEWENLKVTVGDALVSEYDDFINMQKKVDESLKGFGEDEQVTETMIKIGDEVKKTEDRFQALTSEIDTLKKSINEISETKVAGMSEDDLRLLNKRDELDKARLNLLDTEKRKQEEITNISKNYNISRKEAEGFLGQQILDTEQKQRDAIDRISIDLETMELQKKINYDTELQRIELEQQVKLDAQNNELKGIKDIRGQAETTYIQIMSKLQERVDLTETLNLLNKEGIEFDKQRTKELTNQERIQRSMIGNMEALNKLSSYVFGVAGFAISKISTSKKKNDFVMRPGQEPVSFSPNDTIIGIKDTNSLNKSVNININGNIYGVDSEDISRALDNQLRYMVRT